MPIEIRVYNLQQVVDLDAYIERDRSFLIELYRNGKAVLRTDYGARCHESARDFNLGSGSPGDGPISISEILATIPPFGAFENKVDINRLFVISEPGNYSVVVRKNAGGPVPVKLIGACATFTIGDD